MTRNLSPYIESAVDVESVLVNLRVRVSLVLLLSRELHMVVGVPLGTYGRSTIRRDGPLARAPEGP